MTDCKAELLAMQRVAKMLDKLPKDGQVRVVRWLADKFTPIDLAALMRRS